MKKKSLIIIVALLSDPSSSIAESLASYEVVPTFGSAFLPSTNPRSRYNAYLINRKGNIIYGCTASMHMTPDTVQAACHRMNGNYDVSNSSFSVLIQPPKDQYTPPEFWTLDQLTGKLSFCIGYSTGVSVELKCVEAKINN